VTSASGFSFRQAFYTVPSRLIGHRLHLRIHDDRIDAYLGGSYLFTLPRGRRPAKGSDRTTTHVVDYHHVIGSLRAKPGALANLSYRDALWPRPAYRCAWEALSAARPVREASRTMIALLALAHDQGVEADLAAAITIILENGELPDAALLRAQFTPAASPVPTVLVLTPSPAVYDDLLNNTQHMEMAA
jgi:hypothetical protein